MGCAGIDGAIAIVTGASRGLGRDIAVELAAEGATVACLATRAEHAGGVVGAIEAAGGTARAWGCRVEQAESVRETFADIERALVGRFSGAQVRAALATLEDENYVRSPVKEYYRPVKIRQK